MEFEPRISKFCDLSDFFGRFVKSEFFVFGGIFSGSMLFITSCFSSCRFSEFRRKIFGAKTDFWSGWPSKKHFKCLDEFCEEDRFFEKNWYLHNWFRSLTGNFLDLWRQSLAGLSKVHISRPDILWARTTVFIKPNLLKFFRTLMPIFFGKFWRNYRRCRQNSNLRVRKLFVELLNLRGLFFVLLPTFGQKKVFSNKNRIIENFYSACPKKIFRDKNF